MNDTRSLRAAVGWALPVQVGWALLCALWNFGGAWQIARGLQAPGPTASALAGVILVAMAAAFVVCVRRRPWAYVLLSVLAGLAAFAAVAGAFVKDPALWPSESWRWAGVALNTAGLAAAVSAVVAFLRREPLIRGGEVSR